MRVLPQRFSWGENAYLKYFGGHHLNWCLDLNKWENPPRTHIPISLLFNLLRYEQVSVSQMEAYFLCPCISYHWWTLYSNPKQIVSPFSWFLLGVLSQWWLLSPQNIVLGEAQWAKFILAANSSTRLLSSPVHPTDAGSSPLLFLCLKCHSADFTTNLQHQLF